MSGSTVLPASVKISSASGRVGALARLDDDRGLDPRGVRRGEHAAERGGDQDVDIELQQFVVGDDVGAGIAVERPCFACVWRIAPGRRARLVIIGAGRIADGHDLAIGFVQKLGRVPADVAEALNGDRRAVALARDALSSLSVRMPTPRPVASSRPGSRSLDRLAGDDGRIEAVVLAVLVHDPGHHAMVGAHVGGRDVGVGADDVVDLVDELAREPLELDDAELAGVDRDAALGAAVGNVHDGGLPGHQRGQRADLVEVDLVMVAEAALHRPAGVIVLHAVADERRQLAVVHFDGNLDLHLAGRP